MQEQKIKIISQINQVNEQSKNIFDCLGTVTSMDEDLKISFTHPDLKGFITVNKNQAELTYTYPYANNFIFLKGQNTTLNYESQYGVMALMIDTRDIKVRKDRVTLEYSLLLPNAKIGEYQIEIIFKGEEK